MTYPDPNIRGYDTDEDRGPSLVYEKVLTPEMAQRFDLLAKNFLDRYMSQCWIENDADGFTGWRWDKFKVVRRIAAVANRYGGIIVLGTRHYSNSMRQALDALGGNEVLTQWAGEENCEQGFVDQYGTFLDRTEAWILAEAGNQIVYRDDLPTGTLFSEHLW